MRRITVALVLLWSAVAIAAVSQRPPAGAPPRATVKTQRPIAPDGCVELAYGAQTVPYAVGSTLHNGLVAYYTLDEGCSSVRADIVGAAPFDVVTKSPTNVVGKRGNAYNGTPGQWMATSVEAPAINGDAYTLAYWTYWWDASSPNTNAQHTPNVTASTTNFFVPNLNHNSNGNLWLSHTRRAAGQSSCSGNYQYPPPFNGMWFRHVVTFSTTDGVSGYVNGVVYTAPNAGAACKVALGAGAVPLRVGLYNSASNQNMRLDEIAIWNRVITPAEAAEDFGAY